MLSLFAQDSRSELADINREVEDLFRKGEYDRAVIAAKRALDLAEKSFGPDHLNVALSLNNLALMYKTKKQFADAEPLYKRSLMIRENAMGPDHSSVAESLNNLAELYSDQGKFAIAEPLYERSLEIWEKNLGPDHPHVATSLENIADLYRKTDREDAAKNLDIRAERIRAIPH